MEKQIGFINFIDGKKEYFNNINLYQNGLILQNDDKHISKILNDFDSMLNFKNKPIKIKFITNLSITEYIINHLNITYKKNKIYIKMNCKTIDFINNNINYNNDIYFTEYQFIINPEGVINILFSTTDNE